MFGFSPYGSLVDTERVCGHPSKELSIMAPPEKKNIFIEIWEPTPKTKEK